MLKYRCVLNAGVFNVISYAKKIGSAHYVTVFNVQQYVSDYCKTKRAIYEKGIPGIGCGLALASGIIPSSLAN